MENVAHDQKEVLNAIKGLDQKIEHIDQKVEKIDRRVENIEKRVEHVEQRIEHVERRIERVDQKVDDRIAKVNDRIDEVSEQVGEVLDAVGHFSNETERRFLQLEERLGSRFNELSEGQRKILAFLEKNATRTKKYDAEFTANKAAHDRFEERFTKLEKHPVG